MIRLLHRSHTAASLVSTALWTNARFAARKPLVRKSSIGANASQQRPATRKTAPKESMKMTGRRNVPDRSKKVTPRRKAASRQLKPKKRLSEAEQEEVALKEEDARYAMRQLMARHFRWQRNPNTREMQRKAAAEKRDWNMRLTRLQQKEMHAVALEAIHSPAISWTKGQSTKSMWRDPSASGDLAGEDGALPPPHVDDDYRIPSPKDDPPVSPRTAERTKNGDISSNEGSEFDPVDDLPER